MGACNYSPKYDLVKKNISFNISLASRKHVDSFIAPAKGEVTVSPRKESGAQRLLRMAQEEDEAHVKEMARRKREIENEKRKMSLR